MISLIRPGLALLNPARVTVDALPAPLRSWEHRTPPLHETRQASGLGCAPRFLGASEGSDLQLRLAVGTAAGAASLLTWGGPERKVLLRLLG